MQQYVINIITYYCMSNIYKYYYTVINLYTIPNDNTQQALTSTMDLQLV